MDTISDSFRSLKRSFVDEEESEEEESFITEVKKTINLSWKQRFIAFGICFIVACVFALLGVILVRISVAAFAVLFCVGTIVGVISTFFLVSPIKQVKDMLSVIKIICVTVFIWKTVAELAVLFGIIQFAALAVYCVMLIPFAQ
jgi:uncharacterized membrane protein